ncbi:MAG: hypothetical protein SGJ23_00035 [Alphaproteobacteria bacterium]|nr:hypothetical protein [Alphaproteobacteria bacterium]
MLRYVCDGAPVRQTVRLVASTPRFGGVRWWFVCPVTGRRVRALYLPPGARMFASRHAYTLTYQSRRESGRDRAIVRLLTRHGLWHGAPGPAPAALDDPDPMGFREEARWRRREEARARRNEVRRIARRSKAQA